MEAKISYLIHLADNALILGHRNSEWCGHGPVLEQDIAVSNIALDLIGQARMLYQHAAVLVNQAQKQDIPAFLSPFLSGTPATEDTLAYLRDAPDYRNCLLAEQPNGDWAVTILRQFFFSVYQYFLFRQLQQSSDEQLAAIAAKSLKEVTYHVKWSSEWVIRLGDGTEESHRRITRAIELLWPFTGELCEPVAYEVAGAGAGWGAASDLIQESWLQQVAAVFEEATLAMPSTGQWYQRGGKMGMHGEHLGFILADMQFLQRVYPGNEW